MLFCFIYSVQTNNWNWKILQLKIVRYFYCKYITDPLNRKVRNVKQTVLVDSGILKLVEEINVKYFICQNLVKSSTGKQ